jgi:hypothetical protein
MALPIEEIGLREAALTYVIELYHELSDDNGAPMHDLDNRSQTKADRNYLFSAFFLILISSYLTLRLGLPACSRNLTALTSASRAFANYREPIMMCHATTTALTIPARRVP